MTSSHINGSLLSSNRQQSPQTLPNDVSSSLIGKEAI